VRNPHEASPGRRRLLIGRTDGGRALTLVIEQTVDPTTWLIITGWESSTRERKLLERRVWPTIHGQTPIPSPAISTPT
jgi:hypothetical protein